MSMSIRTAVFGAAAMIVCHAAPSNAQNATFTEIRDAVPSRYFNAASTLPDPGAPNRLVIGFESNEPLRASAEVANVSGTRLATDTLSVVVNAPTGHYITSIRVELSGRGAVNTPGDARVEANWVVNGQPGELGSFGGGQFPSTGSAWASGRTIEFPDQSLTSVPVSLTAQLFAFAANALASAEVDLTSATITVTIAQSTVTTSPRN
jgi:hypothetical protein